MAASTAIDPWRADVAAIRLFGAPGDEQRACYHIPSGDLHLLEPVAGRILELLCERALDSGELIRRLREEFEFEEGIALAEWVDRILLRLANSHLILPAEPFEAHGAPQGISSQAQARQDRRK